ncbi:MAG: hypothetical protein QOD91_2649, partial [Frankiales bacterium]|nr:hypothetical protein [Frankiales bacterium]
TAVGATATIRTGLPASGRGYVVVADGSTGQGSFALSRLAVTPVQFGAPTYDAPTYVAVVGHELRVLDAATNAEVHPLAGNATGVTQVAVSDDRQWVYYLQGATNGCGAGTLMRTRLDGTGTPTKVDTGTGPVTAFAIAGPHAQQLAYATTPCATDQVVHWQTTSGSGQITGFTKPPQAELLALSPDGSSLAGYIKISMQGDVETFALPGAHTLTDGVVPSGCTTAGNSCISAAYASNGDLVYVRGDGQQLTVFRQHGGTTSQLFHVAGAYGGTVDVDPTGTKVLLTDGAAHAWSWTDGGVAQALPGSITDASW